MFHVEHKGEVMTKALIGIAVLYLLSTMWGAYAWHGALERKYARDGVCPLENPFLLAPQGEGGVMGTSTNDNCKIPDCWQCASREAENARLREALSEIREIYTGSEGIPNPETAAEAYVLRLVEQMYKTTVGALQQSGDTAGSAYAV